jgi:hypothetical protein
MEWVLQRRREIGIRMAVGARGKNIARLVTVEVFAMVVVGAVAGVTLGIFSVRYIESLFYQVKGTDVTMLAFPSLAILGAALVIAVVPVMRSTNRSGGDAESGIKTETSEGRKVYVAVGPLSLEKPGLRWLSPDVRLSRVAARFHLWGTFAGGKE